MSLAFPPPSVAAGLYAPPLYPSAQADQRFEQRCEDALAAINNNTSAALLANAPKSPTREDSASSPAGGGAGVSSPFAKPPAQATQPAEPVVPVMLEDVHYAERIRQYLEMGGDVNYVVPTTLDYKEEGRTILHWAALFKREETVVVLLDWDADVTLRDARGDTALDLALASGAQQSAPDLLELLASHAANSHGDFSDQDDDSEEYPEEDMGMA